MPFTQVKLAIDFLRPDLALRLYHPVKTRPIALLNSLNRVAERMACVQMSNGNPFPLAAVLSSLPLLNREKAVWHRQSRVDFPTLA
jgi:hypothetical protein